MVLLINLHTYIMCVGGEQEDVSSGLESCLQWVGRH
jgi:hypothetical protein